MFTNMNTKNQGLGKLGKI